MFQGEIFHRFGDGTTVGSKTENVSKLSSKGSKLEPGARKMCHRFQAGTIVGSKLEIVSKLSSKRFKAYSLFS